jgi:hypothetical protein
MHGWGITERIEQWSAGAGQGRSIRHSIAWSDGFIRSEWRVTDNNRRALLLIDRAGSAT